MYYVYSAHSVRLGFEMTTEVRMTRKYMKNILTITKEIAKGKTLIRALMNLELRKFSLAGKVIDVGGGQNPSYLRFFKKADHLQFESVDLAGDKKIDLESNALPYQDASADYVLLFNILEHIYNHQALVKETIRVLKSDGTVIGFVPFFVGYHPDPHDYFRYTNESLQKIFKGAGFGSVSVQPVGGGPVLAAFNILMNYFPRFLTLFAFPWYVLLDWIMLKIRPSLADRFMLGYLFVVKK